MNYGKQGVHKQQLALNAKGPKWARKLLLLLFEFLLIAIIGFGIIGCAFGLGVFNSIIATAPSLDTITVTPTGEASFVYDTDGNEIGKLVSANANRIIVDYDQIPINLEHAFVAIEDKRFYEHNGIDIEGILRAGFKAIKNGGLGQGASTITQQLLKNNVFTDWASEENDIQKIKRKIQEQYLAIQLEKASSKEAIITSYMNTINLGQNTLGVQTASLRYFGKDVSELNLTECAVIASITQNPSKWNPITHPDRNWERVQEVLRIMYEEGYITAEERAEALEDDVYSRIEMHNVEVGEGQATSYFVDALTEQVITDLKKAGYSDTQVTTMLYSGGLKIYSTQDSAIQAICDEAYANEDNYPNGTLWLLTYKLSITHADGTVTHHSAEMYRNYFRKKDADFNNLYKSQEAAYEGIEKYQKAVMVEGDEILAESISLVAQPQVSLTICNQSTGEIVAMLGGRGVKEGSRTFNRATMSKRQPGSCFKVLAAFAPAINEGGMTLATTFNDAPFNYTDGTPVVNWYGKNVYKGLSSIRYAIYYSMNVVAVKTLTIITPEVGYAYLKDFGFTTLTEATVINDMVFTDIGQPLALGGLTNGVYNVELNAAYAAIANGGTYIEPKYYTRIEDSKGNVIIDNTAPVKRQVISDQTAFLLTNAMEDTLKIGTATSARFSGMSIAGKTGTTSDGRDVWFSGFTPYYTCTIWTGYDNNEVLRDAEQKMSRKMFKIIMQQIHEGLEDPGFAVPEGLYTVDICSKSGKLPVPGLCDDCIKTEYFTEDTIPYELCDVHYYGNICAYDNQPACEGCPFTYWGVCERVPVENEALWQGTRVISSELDPLLGTTTTTVSDNTHTGYCQHDTSFYNTWGWEYTLADQQASYAGDATKQTRAYNGIVKGMQYAEYLQNAAYAADTEGTVDYGY